MSKKKLIIVESVVNKNLNLFRSNSVIYSKPIDNWEYQILKYTDRETYELVSDWMPYTDSTTFHTYKTCKMRIVSTPQRPSDTHDACLELRLTWDCEAYVNIDGVRYAGIDNNERRLRLEKVMFLLFIMNTEKM